MMPPFLIARRHPAPEACSGCPRDDGGREGEEGVEHGDREEEEEEETDEDDDYDPAAAAAADDDADANAPAVVGADDDDAGCARPPNLVCPMMVPAYTFSPLLALLALSVRLSALSANPRTHSSVRDLLTT
jgi:hypothetical protein